MKQIFLKCIVLSMMMFSLSNCKKDSTAGPVSSGSDITLAISDKLGPYLTNNQGQALYMFAGEADGKNACTGACEAIWPVFSTDLSTAKLNDGLIAGDFATITTADGKKQVTYKGWPLHTYSPTGSGAYGGTVNIAEGAGSTRGDGVDGLWFVAKPTYTIMLADKQLKGLDGNNYKGDYTKGDGNTIYFTDGAGRTIYTFSADSFNLNKFTKPDLSNNGTFPIYEQATIVVPSALDRSLFGTIKVFEKNQMTYKGWPLYYFGKDSVRGLNQAVSFPVVAKWQVAVKDVADPKR